MSIQLLKDWQGSAVLHSTGSHIKIGRRNVSLLTLETLDNDQHAFISKEFSNAFEQIQPFFNREVVNRIKNVTSENSPKTLFGGVIRSNLPGVGFKLSTFLPPEWLVAKAVPFYRF
ncbi:MAG: hypothetical protein ACK2TW_02475 [Anaerolineales bacterium]